MNAQVTGYLGNETREIDAQAMVNGFLEPEAEIEPEVADGEMELTQHLVDDVEINVEATSESINIVQSASSGEETSLTLSSPLVLEDDSSSPASCRPFTKVFGTLWQVMEAQGWQTAQGPETVFISMPGTTFMTFRPNVNVFDSKIKACWKWIASAIPTDNVWDNTLPGEETIWETLWPIVQEHFKWYTMSSGDETWYIQPNTRFEEFLPNVTVFQSKKRAVLQCLANSRIIIQLGDSSSGPCVIDFAQLMRCVVKAVPLKSPVREATTPVALNKHSKKERKLSHDGLLTPVTKSTSRNADESANKRRKLTSNGVVVTPNNKNKISHSKTESGTKKNKVKSTPKKKTPVKSTFKTTQMKITPFKCTFGHVYKELQSRGWHHRVGKFEYDYFSPEYTPDVSMLNVNYFQSSADLEQYLKDSGLWKEVEDLLHQEYVELIQEKMQEEQGRVSKQKVKKKVMTPKNQVESPSCTTKGKRKSSFALAVEADTPTFQVTIGNVVKKLKARGWTYQPGRFEYDYFKPNVTIKTGIEGVDYFSSLVALENYLQRSGLWDEIAEELQHEYEIEIEQEALRLSQEEQRMKGNKTQTVSKNKVKEVTLLEEEQKIDEANLDEQKNVAAISDGIWANTNTAFACDDAF